MFSFVLHRFEQFFLDGNHRSNIQLLITVIGTFLCFIPTYANVLSQIETTESTEAIHNGILFKCASTVSLILAALLFLDLFFDFIMSMVSQAKQQRVKDKKKWDNHVDILIANEKMVFLAGLVILPLTSFLPLGTMDITLLTQCFNRAQLVLIFGALIASLNRMDKNYFPTLITMTIFVIFIIASTLVPYYINTVNYDTKLHAIVTTFTWVPAAILFSLLAYYVFDTVFFHLCGFKRWKIPCCYASAVEMDDNKNNDKKRPDAKLQPYTHGYIYFRLTYCTIIMMFILIRVVLFAKYPTSLPSLNDTTLFTMIIAPILLACCILLFNLRLVKHEAVESLIEMLDAKKSYVRYISHGTCSLQSNESLPSSFMLFFFPFCLR